MRVVAEEADWWNIPNVSPEMYPGKLRVLERHCRAVGRDFDIVKTLANIVGMSTILERMTPFKVCLEDPELERALEMEAEYMAAKTLRHTA